MKNRYPCQKSSKEKKALASATIVANAEMFKNESTFGVYV